ncbi:MAG: AI-2E family transporter [Rhodospirillales bacterium]|nr:AI-2E family transporter [Rhodospirillales bacterium]
MNLLSFTLYTAIAGLTLYLLIVGRALILPFVVALVFWYLIATLARIYGQLGTWGYRVPGWMGMTLAILTFVAVLAAFVDLTRSNINDVVGAAPLYQANLERVFRELIAFLGVNRLPSVEQLREQIDLGNIAGQLASGVAGFAGNVGIILVYVIFLLVEQKGFGAKIDALVGGDPARVARVRRILDRINADVRTYIRVKTLMSAATGGISYLVMIAVGVDLAEFWAVLIFLLNFIPTIGSILGIVFPALLTLVQFADPWVPFIVVSSLLGATQIVTGNVVEPRMMGRSLSISPVVIVISLALWGSIWGVIGMFLSVPITVIAMIVMAQFEATRPVAILLSADGNVSHLEDDGGEGRA